MKKGLITVLLTAVLSACTVNIVKDSTDVRISSSYEGSAKLSIADSNFGGEADSTADEVVYEVIPE
ncbi:hypothetical protein ViPhICP3M1_gp52 [Vibrio phage ICP3]|nr:hypothetical protein ViPhICP3M1_gp52 [Vibrio phage ICP3]USS70704.1 hypothetical protein ViPhICP3M2_gp52 [Vibrio phage ICP3]